MLTFNTHKNHTRKFSLSTPPSKPSKLVGPTVFRGTAEFRAEPQNLGFFRGIEPRNFTAEFGGLFRGNQNLTFFIRTTIFSQKMTSCYKFVYDDFCLMVMVE